MSLLLRAALYAVCLFLVLIVYVGQKQTNATDTAVAAGKLTVKWFAISVVGATFMLALEFLFVDQAF